MTNEELRKTLHIALSAMNKAMDEGFLDHIDCAEDGGAFWRSAVRRLEKAIKFFSVDNDDND